MRPDSMSAETARAVLNVGAWATRSEVDQAFRAQARLCHPDRFAGSSAVELTAAGAQFVRVCDARDTLHRTLPAAGRPARSEPRPAASAQSPRSNSAPRPETLTFADFVRVKEASAWTYDRPPGPTRRRRARRLHRTSDAFRVALLALALVTVGGLLTVYFTTDAPPTSPASATDLLAGATVLEADAATDTSACIAEAGCWIWSVTARADCPVATITVNFFDTAAPGATTRTSTRQVAVLADTPFAVIEPALGGASELATIASIIC